MNDSDSWRDLHDRFMALKAEEDAVMRMQAPPRHMCAFGTYDGPVFGQWTISDGPNENFKRRYEVAATRAGLRLDPPRETRPLHYWLHYLLAHLRQNNSQRLRIESEDGGGVIEFLCEASATFSAYLEVKALETATANSPEFEISPQASAKLSLIHVRWLERDTSVIHSDPLTGRAVKKNHTDLFKRNCRDAFDVIAQDQEGFARTLTDEIITNTIPASVFDFAVANAWFRLPSSNPQPPVRRVVRASFLGDTSNWFGDLNRDQQMLQEPAAKKPMPPPIQFGSHAVQQSIRDWFLGLLAGRIEHWNVERKKQTSAQTQSTISVPVSVPYIPFARRAEWLRDRLRERSWDHNHPSGFGGPDRKTMLRMLEGLRVSEDSLRKTLVALNKKKIGKIIELLDIPND